MSKASLHACLTSWHKHRTKVCCCSEAPSLIPRKATHLKRQLHLHGMPVEFYPKVLVDTSNPWYNWTILRKASSSCLVQLSFSAIAMAIAFSRRKLILWANHLCFSNCNASPTDNFLFFKRNLIVSLNTDYLKKLEPKCLSMISTSSTGFLKKSSKKSFFQSNF